MDGGVNANSPPIMASAKNVSLALEAEDVHVSLADTPDPRGDYSGEGESDLHDFVSARLAEANRPQDREGDSQQKTRAGERILHTRHMIPSPA